MILLLLSLFHMPDKHNFLGCLPWTVGPQHANQFMSLVYTCDIASLGCSLWCNGHFIWQCWYLQVIWLQLLGTERILSLACIIQCSNGSIHYGKRTAKGSLLPITMPMWVTFFSAQTVNWNKHTCYTDVFSTFGSTGPTTIIKTRVWVPPLLSQD